MFSIPDDCSQWRSNTLPPPMVLPVHSRLLSGSDGAHHADARVDPRAELGVGVSIGPFAVIEAGARVGDRCHIAAHAVVRSAVVLGADVHIDSFVVVGGAPQVRQLRGEPGLVHVDRGAVLREGVTVHRSTAADGCTYVGSDAFLMAYSHVAHDCVIESGATLSNNVMLGGHVRVGSFAVVGGGTGIHQFVRIGESAMVGGNAAVTRDIPPFTLVSGRNLLHGLNNVGVKRRGFGDQTVGELRRCLRIVCATAGDPRRRAAELLAQQPSAGDEVRRFLAFFGDSRRGFVRLRARDA
jgi:UDP-N-acetylglucosamine acyltransferase